MKKIAFIAAIACSALTAGAQNARNPQHFGAPYRQPRMAPSSLNLSTPTEAGPEGGTATPFWTENFGSGTNTTLPTGWSAASGPGVIGTWVWRKVAGTTTYSIGVINSTTGGAPTSPTNNGWMMYNSDSLGALNTANPISGTLTSPIINCTGHSTVQLSFQQWFRHWYDSCFVEVSNNSGGTYTRFQVTPNNTLTDGASLSQNPTTAYINISSVAANQPNVRIRFYYYENDPLGEGGYNWLIDDVALAELDPVELGVDYSTYVMRLGPGRGYTSFGQYPKQLADSVYPAGFVTNYGSMAQTTANYTARIFRSGSQVYNQSLVYNTPLNAVDSAVEFTGSPGFRPVDTGVHTIVFSVNQAGDVVAGNNTDTTSFRITDSVLSMNVGRQQNVSYYVQRPSTDPNGVSFNHVGVWFDIPQGKSGMIKAVQVAVSAGTTVGTTLQAQLFKFDGTDYQPFCETVPRTLTSSDISSASNLVFFRLPIDLTSQYVQTILDSGFYAVVVRGVGNDDDSTILIPGFETPANKLGYEFGTISESDNAPLSYSYGIDGPFFLENFTPTVRPVIGPVTIGVKDVYVATLGAAFPNPANTQVSIPVSLSIAFDVAVTLTNVLGQVLARQTLGHQAAGQRFEITFPTAALAPGLYFYTVEAAGEKTTGRIAVTH